MRLIEKGRFLEGVQLNVIAQGSARMQDTSSERHTEAETCATQVSKYAHEVMLRCNQTFGDLRAACVEFVLSLPSELRNLNLQVPALVDALQQGIDSPEMISLALDTLETWVATGVTGLREFLPQILPHLNEYLFVQDITEDVQSGKIESQDVRLRRARERRKREMARGLKVRNEQESHAGSTDVCMRVMQLLGKLGSDNVWLVQEFDIDVGATGERLDTSMKLLSLDLKLQQKATSASHQKDEKDVLILDAMVPRLAHLAEKSPDAKLRATACEVLHAIVVFAIGLHRQSVLKARRDDPDLRFHALFRFIFPVVFRLSIKADAIAVQLFQPLTLQIIHWFTSRHNMEVESDILLDAILAGVECKDDAKVRDAASKHLNEYMKWTLKENKNAQNEEDAEKTKKMLRRLYSLMNHPDVSKRLGAFGAVKELGGSREGLRRFPRVIDQFLLELMHNCIMSLKFCERDEPGLQTAKAGVAALMTLRDGILLKNEIMDKLMGKRKDGRFPRRRHEDLGVFVSWLFEQIGSHEKDCRRFCMDLFTTVGGKLPGCKKPEDWIKTNAIGRLQELFEGKYICMRAQTLEHEMLYLQHLTTALDVYEWMLNAAYVRPGDIFLATKPSDLTKGLELFLDEKASAKLPAQIKNRETPAKILKYSYEKAKCLYALIKFVATLLERHPQYDISSSSARILVSGSFFQVLYLGLLAPGTMELDAGSDPLVLVEIPKQAERLFRVLQSGHTLHKPLLDDAKQQLVTLIHGSPNVDLTTLDSDKATFSKDELRLYFTNFGLLKKHSIFAGNADIGTKLLNEVWTMEVKSASYADIVMAEAKLRLGLSFLTDFSLFWGKLFGEIRSMASENWQESAGWVFYSHFKVCVLEYISSNMAHAASEYRIFRDAVNTTAAAALLIDLLDHRGRLEASQTDGSSQSLLEESTKMVQVFLDNFTHIEDLASARDDDKQERKRQAIDIINKLVKLRAEIALDQTNAQKVCRAYCSLLTSNKPALSALNLAQALEALPEILDRAPQHESEGVLRLLRIALAKYIPDVSGEFKVGSESYNNFQLVFSSLMSVVMRCTRPTVYALLKLYALKERAHEFQDLITKAVDAYVLNMDESNRAALLDIIMLDVFGTEGKDRGWVSLEIDRNIIQHMCLRLLHAVENQTLLEFFQKHFKSLLEAIRKKAAEDIAVVSDKMCAYNVVQAVYQNLPYKDIEERVHTLWKEPKQKHLTADFLAALGTDRKAVCPGSWRDERSGRLFFTWMRTVQNTISFVVCRTQTKEDLFDKLIFQNIVWENVIDVKHKHELPVEAGYKQTFEQLAEFRTKRKANNKVQGRPTLNTLRFGSLTQDVSSGFQSFSSSFVETYVPVDDTKISDGGEIRLEHDSFNENECMRPLLAVLDHMNSTKELRPGSQMPKWMRCLCEKLGEGSEVQDGNAEGSNTEKGSLGQGSKDRPRNMNIRLFIAKLIINYNKLCRNRANRARRSPADQTEPVVHDMFKRFASEFFDGFFNDKNGIAFLISRPSEHGPTNSFNYFLRDICILWMDWTTPDVSQDGKVVVPAFRLKDSQVDHAWKLIKHLIGISAHKDTKVTESNVQIIQHFITEWRGFASRNAIVECMERTTTKMMPLLHKDDKDEIKQEEKWLVGRAGLQVLLILMRVEVGMLQDTSSEGRKGSQATVRIDADSLEKAFLKTLECVRPVQHKNKENRKYTSKKLLIPAACTCAQAIAVAAERKGLSDDEDKSWSLVEQRMKQKLTDALKTCFESEALPDQLLTVLDTVISVYPEYAGTRYCVSSLLKNLKQHGTYLNMVQQMLCEHIKWIWRLPAQHDIQEHEQTSEDEVQEHVKPSGDDIQQDKGAVVPDHVRRYQAVNDLRELMIKLPEMLRINDEKSQMLALRILTGRDEYGRLGDTWRSEEKPSDESTVGLLPPVGGDVKMQQGLLPFLGAQEIERLWNVVKGVFPRHTSKTCRLHFYLLAMDLHANVFFPARDKEHRNIADIQANACLFLIPALTDSCGNIRKVAFEWYDQRFLPKNAPDRLREMLDTMHSSPVVGNFDWLNSAAVLLLDLVRHDPEYKSRKLFDDALDSKAHFSDLNISTWVTSSLPNAPMFARPSASLSASQQGSLGSLAMSQQSQGGDGGILATLATDDDGLESMDVDERMDVYFANQTQQAGVFMPQKPRAKQPRPATKPLSAQGMRGLGAFAMPSARLPAARFDKGNQNKQRLGQEMAMLSEQSKKAKERTAEARKKQVRMRRNYKIGEIPDITIPVDDIVRTLRAVAEKDSVMAKLVFVQMFESVKELGRSMDKAELRQGLQQMLQKPSSSDLVEALLDVAHISDAALDASLVARACTAPHVCSWYHGIRFLERQAKSAVVQNPDQNGIKRKSTGPRKDLAKHIAAHTEQAREMSDDNWMQLSRLYSSLQEQDIVLGLCEKTSKLLETRNALDCEMKGRYKEAQKIYTGLIERALRVEDGEEDWTDQEPSEVEKAQWEQGMESCYKNLLRWERLKEYVKDNVLADEDEDGNADESFIEKDTSESIFEKRIWDRKYRTEMHTYMRCLLGLCTQKRKEGIELKEFVEDAWLDETGKLADRKQLLTDEFGIETCLALLLGNKESAGKDLVRKGLGKFLAEWVSSDSIGVIAKRAKLRTLQRFVELGEYASTVEQQKDALSRPQLAQAWGSRVAGRNDTNCDAWDGILTSRLMLLEKLGAESNVNESINRLYLSMSRIARLQGSFDVSKIYLKNAEERAADHRQCAMTKAKLYVARCHASDAKDVAFKVCEKPHSCWLRAYAIWW
jgi:hypothetical protein